MIVQPQTHTIIVYEGISDKNAILIVFGSFFGSILVGIAIITGARHSKYKLGTNKSELIYDRLENSPVADVRITNSQKLGEFTELAQMVGELKGEVKMLRDEVHELTSEVEKLKGRVNER